MREKKAGLFDLDGVILDTEGYYSLFWSEMGRLFYPDVLDFSNRIKGKTLKELLTSYFPDKNQAKVIVDKITEFESQMSYNFIAGLPEFIEDLRRQGVKLAIVTSSNNMKMENVYWACPELKEWFDTIVTADKITHSKPHPECYLLAAEELGVSPDECWVFEDSFSGLEAGRSAGMTVVGLATTNPSGAIQDKADIIIPNFTGLTYERLVNKFVR